MSKRPHAPRKNNQQSPRPQDDSQDHCVHPPVVPPTPGNTDNTKDPKDATSPWWERVGFKGFLEIVGLLAGIGYAIVTYCQWRDMRHNFELDQRAWIKIACPLPADLNRLLSTTAEVKNFGKSIALRLDMYARMMIVKKGATPPFDIPGPILHSHASALFPSDAQTLPINAPDRPGGPNLTSADFDSLSAGNAYVVVYGGVTYKDQFGPHWTRFCNWIAYADGHYAADTCVSYTSVGDGDSIPIK